MKTIQVRVGKGYLFRAHDSRRVNPFVWQRFRGRHMNWKVLNGKKGEGFKYLLLRGCCHGEPGNRLTGSRASSMVLMGAYLVFSGCS